MSRERVSRTNKSVKGQEKEDRSYNLCDVRQTQGPDVDAIIKKVVEIATATIKTEIAEIINTKLQKDLRQERTKLCRLRKRTFH